MDRLGQFSNTQSQPHLSPTPTTPTLSATDDDSQKFFTQINQIKQQVTTYDTDSDSLKRMYEMSLQTVDTAQLASLQQSISAKSDDISTLGQQIASQLTALTEQTQQAQQQHSITSSVARIRFNILTGCSTRFSALVRSFQTMQVNAKAVIGEQAKRQLLIVNPKASVAELQAVAEGQVPLESMFESASRMEATQALEKLQVREDALKRLEKSLIQLHRLFVDMQMLVGMQGKMLDSIEGNVENVAEYTEEASKTMDKAAEWQKAAWKKKAWFIMILFAIVAVLILLKVLHVC